MPSSGPAADEARADVRELIAAKGHAVDNAREVVARLEQAFADGALATDAVPRPGAERPRWSRSSRTRARSWAARAPRRRASSCAPSTARSTRRSASQSQPRIEPRAPAADGTRPVPQRRRSGSRGAACGHEHGRLAGRRVDELVDLRRRRRSGHRVHPRHRSAPTGCRRQSTGDPSPQWPSVERDRSLASAQLPADSTGVDRDARRVRAQRTMPATASGTGSGSTRRAGARVRGWSSAPAGAECRPTSSSSGRRSPRRPWSRHRRDAIRSRQGSRARTLRS